MITFFTTAKPFVGHSGVIQRNALKSWTLVHPFAEVILFGNETGARSPQKSSGIRHEPLTRRKMRFGTNRMDYMFARAQDIARHDVLCYTNCDIIFMEDFRAAWLDANATRRSNLLWLAAGGTRTLHALAISSHPDWQKLLHDLALQTGKQRTGTGSTISFFHAVCSRICHHSWLAAFFGTTGWCGRHWM